MISVVIPVLNGAETIGEQLRALGAQDVNGPWEVIVADNGSTDATVQVTEKMAGAVPRLQVVDASSRRGPAAARNIGAESALGDLLVFCDADDVVSPGWLGALEQSAAEHDFMAGSIDFHALNPRNQGGPNRLWEPRVGAFNWLEYALGANMAVSRRAFQDVGGFTEELRAGEDLDLSWRLQLAGYRLHHVPEAVVRKRPRGNDGHKVRQHFQYGIHDVSLYRRLRESGMPRRSAQAQLRLYGWLGLNVWRLATRGPGRTTWLISAASAFGRVVGSARHRVIFL